MKKKWGQIIHKKCGGEIVPISNGKIMELCCKKCRTRWKISLPLFGIKSLGMDSVSEEFGIYEEEKQ